MLLQFGNFMTVSALFYTFLLLNIASSTSERISNNIDQSRKFYTSSWAVQLRSSARDDDARFIANTLGLKYQKILPNNYYLLIDENSQNLVDKPNEQIAKALKSFPKVIWVEQQAVEQFDSRAEFSEPNDPLWRTQTHLKSSSPGHEISQHVEDVWAEGYTGKNVTVVVIDDGVRGTHHELRNRYDTIVSTNLSYNSSQSSGHGTKCAGVIAAEANNNLCGVGVAYDCNIAGIQLLLENNATDAAEAQAFYRDHINPSKADIFSCSWGPLDRGYTTRGPGRLAAEALKQGIEKGRNGLGSIYVFSCGNGAPFEDSCAFDGYVNSIYTIPVAYITNDGKVSRFSEPCSAIMTAVFSTDMVTISGKSDTECVSDFGRTSAAAAFVSGILALALEVNRNLTWRDMQHLIARSSTWNGVDPDVQRVTNAKKFTVNENFGFGVLDALALVNNARKWNVNVPEQVMCTMNITGELGTRRIPTTFNVTITENNINCKSRVIKSLEHVQLRLDLEYTNRAVLIVDVISPSGTLSRFVYPRRYDSIGSPRTYSNLVVTSVHFWGESLLGNWTVEIKEGTGGHNIQGTGTLVNMSFTFYGIQEFLKDNDNETDIDDNGNNNDNGNDDDDDDGNGNDDDDNDHDDDDDDDDDDDADDDDDDKSNDSSESTNGAIIAGSVIAGCALIALALAVAYKLKRRSNNSTRRSGPKQQQELEELSKPKSPSIYV